jgi:hypothetical protein
MLSMFMFYDCLSNDVINTICKNLFVLYVKNLLNAFFVQFFYC